MKRAARIKQGSVVYNRRFGTWNFLWCEKGKRRSKVIGTRRELPTKAAAWRAAQPLRSFLEDPLASAHTEQKSLMTMKNLVTQYRNERMPRRMSTQRGYESWLKNYVLPHFGDSEITDLQARPVELWLQSLALSPKSKLHIRGMLRVLWEYAMWAGHVPNQRNPMELV